MGSFLTIVFVFIREVLMCGKQFRLLTSLILLHPVRVSIRSKGWSQVKSYSRNWGGVL